MRKPPISHVVYGLVCTFLASFAFAKSEPAFPGAEGFGALAIGGRGGGMIHVTTLADSGPGSFRDAVSKSGRLVHFSVSGVIELKSNVSVKSDITIDGSDAPGDGITLHGRSTSFSGEKNIIVRYVRFREGIVGDRGRCAVNIVDGHDIILDHCSIEWGRWDCLGITKGSSDVTLQYCIIGQGIDPQRFGALVDSVQNITFHHNLWIHNQSRNPKAKGTIQYINNVVYDWGVTGLTGGHSEGEHAVDVIGNYLVRGPSSNEHAIGEFTSTDQVFQFGNMVDLDRDGMLNGRPVTEADFKDSNGAPTFHSSAQLSPDVPVTAESAGDALVHVLKEAGDSLHRDAVDQKLIEDVKSFGTRGSIIHSDTESRQ